MTFATDIKPIVDTLRGLITLPSLYIFSCLNGLDVSLHSVAAVLGASLALVSLLLIGLAPVLWIFTQSTDSLVFLGMLSLLFWGGSLAFGLSLIFKGVSAAAAPVGGRHSRTRAESERDLIARLRHDHAHPAAFHALGKVFRLAGQDGGRCRSASAARTSA